MNALLPVSITAGILAFAAACGGSDASSDDPGNTTASTEADEHAGHNHAVVEETDYQPKGRTVEYADGDTILAGYLALPEAADGSVPGILVVHEWNGLGTYVQRRCDMLADLGYVAFGADIYGKGVRPDTMEACRVESGKYREDLGLYRRRLDLALTELLKIGNVDPARIGAMGYCFGGTGVLELARSGADVRGVVSFHGGLGTLLPAEEGGIAAEVLVLHGADDPFVPVEQVEAFEEEMTQAGATFEVVKYPGAKHGFTNDKYPVETDGGQAYHPEADKKSWNAMQAFFARLFQ